MQTSSPDCTHAEQARGGARMRAAIGARDSSFRATGSMRARPARLRAYGEVTAKNAYDCCGMLMVTWIS